MCGNLENTVERLLILREGDTVSLGDLAGEGPRHSQDRLIRIDRQLFPRKGIRWSSWSGKLFWQALERNDWNQTAASRFLRIPRHVLIYRMEKYEIVPPGKGGKEAENAV